ncbi:hypothetical protein CHLV3229_09850 [Campylobacter helveticus]|nr:hypothetical protein [Campylobacter helveticus]MCR2067161.1 hypothetical protein [Campylobacter helveticus]
MWQDYFTPFKKTRKSIYCTDLLKRVKKTPKNELEIAYKKLKELNDE